MAETGTNAPAKLRQVAACYTLSVRRFVVTKFMLANLLLAAIPVFIAVMVVVFSRRFHAEPHEIESFFENLLRTLYLHFILIFIAFTFGFSVMRQDREDQTLHYLLLQPIDRWMIVAGKFAAYLTLAFAACAASLWITYFVLRAARFVPREIVSELFAGGRLVMLLQESGVLLLGLMAYGALALLASSFFKSPFFSLLLLGWEAGTPWLPTTLKLWSVTHYLHSLLPNRAAAARKLIEVLGEPTPPMTSIAILLIFSGVLVACSIALFRSKECIYSEA